MSTNSIFLRSILIFFSVLCSVQPVLAHGAEPRLEISVERVNPGGEVEIRGVDFDYEETVALSLIGSNIQIPLNEITTDVEGTFAQVIVLPADLPAGEYTVYAKSEHHAIMSPTISVWGTATENRENGGILDQSDVQFEPLPTTASVLLSTPLPQKTALETPAAEPGSLILLYSIVAGVGILSLLGIRILKKQ